MTGDSEVSELSSPLKCLMVHSITVEESHLEGSPGEPLLIQQVELVLADVLGTQLVRGLVKVAGKLGNRFRVAPDRMIGVGSGVEGPRSFVCVARSLVTSFRSLIIPRTTQMSEYDACRASGLLEIPLC